MRGSDLLCMYSTPYVHTYGVWRMEDGGCIVLNAYGVRHGAWSMERGARSREEGGRKKEGGTYIPRTCTRIPYLSTYLTYGCWKPRTYLLLDWGGRGWMFWGFGGLGVLV